MRRSVQFPILALLLAVFAPSASAAPILRLEQGPHVVTIGDIDSDGVVAFAGTVGTYQVNLTFGASGTASFGTSESALLDLISGNATGTGGTLKVTLADTGYTLPSAPIVASATVTGALVAPFGGSLTFQSWINLDDLSPLTGLQTSTPGDSVVLYTPTASVTYGVWDCLVCAFSHSDTTLLAYEGGDFSLFSQAIITLNGAGAVVFNQGVEASSSNVPEPVSVALMGTAVVSAVAAARRRRSRRSR